MARDNRSKGRLRATPIILGEGIEARSSFAGPPAEGGSKLFSISVNRNKLKSPSWVPGIPSDFWPVIGQLAVCWGGFENQMNELIAALLRATGEEVEAAQFKAQPLIVDHIRKAVATAAQVHWRRNMILHGDVTCRVTGTAQRPCITLETVGRHNGKDRVLNYTTGEIEDLFYEVIHATALLRFGPLDLDALRLSSPDTQTLRDFAASNLPHPNEAMRPNPPPSFDV